MAPFDGCSLFVQNFKCIGADKQGVGQVRRLNLIIGRNNTGKSALLDLVRFAVKPYDLAPYAYKHKVRPSVSMLGTLDETLVRSVFSESTGGGGIPGRNHFEYGKKLVGTRMGIELPRSGERNGKFTLDTSMSVTPVSAWSVPRSR